MVAKKQIENEPARELISDISALETLTVNVEVEWYDGTIKSVPMRTLSFGRWLEIERMVAEPDPPIIGGNAKGVIYDYNNANYLNAKAAARERRLMLKLAESIALELPGETLAEKADYIQTKMDGVFVNSLGIWLNQSFGSRLVRAANRAENFHGNGEVGS